MMARGRGPDFSAEGASVVVCQCLEAKPTNPVGKGQEHALNTLSAVIVFVSRDFGWYIVGPLESLGKNLNRDGVLRLRVRHFRMLSAH
jgi:hypothetical protein